MAAYTKSLSLANLSHIIRTVASLILDASEGDRDGEFSAKIYLLPFLHSHAMKTAHWVYLFAVIDSPCAQLVRLRTASPALSLP